MRRGGAGTAADAGVGVHGDSDRDCAHGSTCLSHVSESCDVARHKQQVLVACVQVLGVCVVEVVGMACTDVAGSRDMVQVAALVRSEVARDTPHRRYHRRC